MAQKPDRIRHHGAAVFVDDVDLDRVQAVTANTTFNTEDMMELGTLNILEIQDDVPTVELSIDTNEYGSNKTLASFANKGFGLRVFAVPVDGQAGSDKIFLEEGSVVVNGVRVWIDEVPEIALTPSPSGGETHFAATVSVKPDPAADPKYTITYAYGDDTVQAPAAPAGEIPVAQIKALPVSGFMVTQDDIVDVRDFKTIKIEDYEFAHADVYIPVKYSATGNVERTAYIENAYLTGIDLSYSSDGVATENITAQADNKRWFQREARNIVSNVFRANGAVTTLDLTNTPTQLLNGKFMLEAVKNGNPLVEGVDFTVNAGSKKITLTQAATAGDMFKFRYTTNEGNTFHVSDAQDGQPVSENNPRPAAVRQGYIEVFLNDTASGQFYRVNSATISAALEREELRQLNTFRPYARPLNLPVEITVSLEFTDSDLEAFAKFANRDVNNAKELNILHFVKNTDLIIRIYRLPDDKRAELPAGHPWTKPLKEIFVKGLVPTSENWNVQVQQNATQSFDFRSFYLSITA